MRFVGLELMHPNTKPCNPHIMAQVNNVESSVSMEKKYVRYMDVYFSVFRKWKRIGVTRMEESLL